jgi:hypothetical protein
MAALMLNSFGAAAISPSNPYLHWLGERHATKLGACIAGLDGPGGAVGGAEDRAGHSDSRTRVGVGTGDAIEASAPRAPAPGRATKALASVNPTYR